MTHHILCNFFIRRVTIGDASIDNDVPEERNLEDISKLLGVDTKSLPNVFEHIIVKENNIELKYHRLVDECELNPESIYQFSDSEEWNDYLSLVRNGVILMDSFFWEDQVIYSGYGKLVCALNVEHIPWKKGDEVRLGDYMIRFIESEDFTETMVADYDKVQEMDELSEAEPSKFYEALINEISYDEEFSLAMHCLENNLGRALTFILENELIKPLGVDIGIDGSGDLLISTPSYANILFEFEKSKPLVESLNVLYNFLATAYTEEERGVRFAPLYGRYNAGTCFKQFIWLNKQPLPKSPFTEKNRNLTPEHLAFHLISLGATSIRRNALVSEFGDDLIAEGYSAFDKDGNVVAKFQIEHYTNNGDVEFNCWIENLMSHLGLELKRAPLSDFWKLTWNLSFIDVDRAMSFHGKSKIFACECPDKEKSDVKLLNIKLIADDIKKESYLAKESDQSALSWFFGNEISNLGLEAYAFPVMLIPDELVYETSSLLRNNLIDMEDFSEINSVASEITKVVYDSSAELPENRRNIDHQYIIFVAVKCRTPELSKLFKKATRNPMSKDYEKIVSESGNALIFSHHLEHAEKHYRLDGIRGADIQTNINMYDL